MKKEINSKSRRKWIRGGMAAFASVALLTTGFAVWVVGVQQKENNKDIGVTVDTAQNNSLYFDAKLTDADIVLAEATEVTEGFVQAKKETSGTTVVENPLRITFSEITINYGDSLEEKPTKIQFSIDNAATGKVGESAKEYSTVTTTVNETGRTGDSWTYIDAPKEVILPTADHSTETEKFEQDPSTNNVTIKITGLSVDFLWGSYFGNTADSTTNKSPCTYYNEQFTDAKANTTYANSVKIQNELDKMYKALNGKVIRLKATLVK